MMPLKSIILVLIYIYLLNLNNKEKNLQDGIASYAETQIMLYEKMSNLPGTKPAVFY